MGIPGIKSKIEKITKRYFVDPTTETLGDITIENWNVLMGVFTYVGRRNMLMVGRPGTGKTTLASIIGSVCSGLPFDLYDFLKIPGHPDQTKDTMLARIDLGRIAEEDVVWQPSVYLPLVILDELNRLSPGKQSVIIEFARTGMIEHLGKYFSNGKPAFFATINHNGPGTYPIPQPMLDRFDIAIELTPGPFYVQELIRKAGRNQHELTDPKRTEEIITRLLQKDVSIDEKCASLNIEDCSPDIDLPLTPDAKTFLGCIWEEINTTRLYGDNRPGEADTSNHNAPYASSKVSEGISSRAYDSIMFYSTMLASYLGHDKIGIEYIQTIAPYCLAHRLPFTEDFAAKFEEQPRERNERRDMHLARMLISEIKKNYDAIHIELKLMDVALKGNLTTDQQKMVTDICNGPEPDHPLQRVYYHALK